MSWKQFAIVIIIIWCVANGKDAGETFMIVAGWGFAYFFLLAVIKGTIIQVEEHIDKIEEDGQKK